MLRQKLKSSDFHIRVQNETWSSRDNLQHQQCIWPRNCEPIYSAVVEFKKFCKDKSLEDEEHSGRPSEVDNNQLRAIIEADPFTTTQEAARQLNIDHSMVIWHLKQIGKVKQLDKWVPHELTENQKYHCFEVSIYSLILHNNNKPFLHQIVTSNEKWIYETNSDDQLSGWTETLRSTSESQTCTKKVMVTVWWCVASLIH